MGVPPVILVDVRLDAYVTDGLGTTSQKSRKAEATNSLRARKPSTISRQILLLCNARLLREMYEIAPIQVQSWTSSAEKFPKLTLQLHQ